MCRKCFIFVILLPLVTFGVHIRARAESSVCEDAPPLEAYQPTSDAPFVTLDDATGRFAVDNEPFIVRGVNYYPANYPWRRFLTETDQTTVQTEFALLQETGFNTLRIFLWNEALFPCAEDKTIPDAEAFQRLDMLMGEAAAHDLYLLVTLNDLPDLTDTPLYDNPEHVQAQTEVIVTRYRDEPAILAWDLRNEGDIDYDSVKLFEEDWFPRSDVIGWLEQTSAQVNALDDNHLITAGWRFNEQHTLPYVDFISFHHWQGAASLRERVQAMGYDKPALLQEFGYPTSDIGIDQQAQAIRDVVRLVEDERSDIMGWMIWTAFDFPLTATCYPGECVSVDNREHHFGIWYSDYTPKPAVDLLTAELARLDAHTN